jgi:hypothetical protein
LATRPLTLVAVAVAAAVLGAAPLAEGRTPPEVTRELLLALGGADLVVFEERRPPRPTNLALAARVRAPADRLLAVLADPAAYRRAVPAFVKANVIKEDRAAGAPRPAWLLDWELEIPLWNLEGKLWMRPVPDGVRFDFVEGDLVPGSFVLTARPEGAGSTLTIEGSANLRDANFVTRRLAGRHALAEPAMAATAAYVLLRALVLDAERTAGAPLPQRRPGAAMAAPPVAALDGSRLASAVAASALDPRSVVAAVRSRPDGRLDRVEVALVAPHPPAVVVGRLGEPGRWQALPGWGDLEERRLRPGTAGPVIWEVDSGLPFVDFDAEWQVTSLPRWRAFVHDGDWRGPVMGWDVAPGGGKGPAVAVFSLNPRLDNTGYMPRKLIEAEPLLEHGLAVGLGYVDAASLVQALR